MSSRAIHLREAYKTYMIILITITTGSNFNLPPKPGNQQGFTDDFTHELDDWEMDREWDGLENTVDRKQYVEFTPGKGKRESESMLDRENLKRKEGITPPKGTTPKKNKE